jgi:hypothetical protein
MSWGDARAALKELRRGQPDSGSWQLIPIYETVP